MEKCDVYNRDGKRTNKIVDRGEELHEDEYYLITDVWIQNTNGDYLITKRSSLKKPDPNLWESTTGCVLSGENSLDAAIREAYEELSISLDKNKAVLFRRIFTDFHAIIDVWVFNRDDIDINNIVFEKDKVVDVKWASLDSIHAMIEKKEFVGERRLPYVYELDSSI